MELQVRGVTMLDINTQGDGWGWVFAREVDMPQIDAILARLHAAWDARQEESTAIGRQSHMLTRLDPDLWRGSA
jgi:hypothetical protein